MEYWKANAPFYGVPFKADISQSDFEFVLQLFSMDGENCCSAV